MRFSTHPLCLELILAHREESPRWRQDEPILAVPMPATEGDQIELIRELIAGGEATAFVEQVGVGFIPVSSFTTNTVLNEINIPGDLK